MRALFAWVGFADFDAEARGTEGPILGALRSRPFDEVWLLSNAAEDRLQAYLSWLTGQMPDVRKHPRRVGLSQPNAFTEIYKHASAVIAEAIELAPRPPHLTFHLSPGTPVMASVWLLLATSRFPAELIESSAGSLNTVEKPFNLPAQVLPDLLRDPDRRLREATAERPEPSSSFHEIAAASEPMQRAISLARKAAPRNVPLLIEGESGTGKELFAQAVHQASPRAARKMIVINCGAIPETLIESRLFGHVKGAFTGADRDQIGCFEEADGSTLFLDEVGELSLPAQVALLRVLQEGEITPLGKNDARRVDVRIISATHRNLTKAIAEGRFREDLFYRLAVLRLRLPALRDRGDDLALLIDQGLNKINAELSDDPLYTAKWLSRAARDVLMEQQWRGNVRELHNTMRRALVWSDDDELSADDVRNALFLDHPTQDEAAILGRPIGSGFNLDMLLDEVASHYIERALDVAAGNKSRAAKLIGYASYQRLDQRRRKLGI